MPRFSVVSCNSNGNATNLGFDITNISENNAQNLIFFNIRILNPQKEIYWESTATYTLDFLPANEKKSIKLTNPSINDKYELHIEMSCSDKYNEPHNYIIKGHMNAGKTFPTLKIIELY